MQNNSFFDDFNHLNQVTNLKTYLSDEVYDIVNVTNSFHGNITPILSQHEIWTEPDNLILNYKLLANECIEWNQKENCDLYFKKSLTNLNKYFQPIKENILKVLDASKHASLFFGDDIEFFQKNVINQLYIYVKSNNRINLYISFLNIFLMFERSLGDLIYSDNFGESCSIPFLLKDLVYNKTVLTFLTKPLCDLLAIFIYTPRSLNLRNLIWHGFWQPNELNEDYIFFFISIITSINGILLNRITNKTINTLKQRPKINLCEFSKRNYENSVILENFAKKFTHECSIIIQNSKLIDNKEIWMKAFTEAESSFDIIILLLPQIEHLLRKLYSLYNLDSECQIAKVDEYYMTIDDLLMFDDQNKFTKNRLIEKLDPHLILFAYELFIYEDGPRLRDRASHGELNQKEIPKYYADCVQFLSILLASQSIYLSHNKDLKLLDSFRQEIFSNFDSIHHPISILKKKTYVLIDLSVDFFVDFSKTNNYGDSVLGHLKKVSEQIEDVSRKRFKFNIFSKDSLQIYWKITDVYSFIYRYDMNKDLKSFKANEIQLIKLLIRIFDQLYKLLKLIKEFLQQALLTKDDHCLRQRKRENIDSFFKNKECFQIFIKLSLTFLIYFIENNIIQINIGKLYPSEEFTKFDIIIKYLKNYLKVIENLCSKSGFNKWVECKNLIVESNVNLFSNFFELLIF